MSRVVVVTGATRGIGRELARQLAVRGDRVVLGGRRAADGQRTAAELAEAGATVDPRQLDVADPGSVARFAEELARDHAAVDVLVNNAAVDYDTGQRASTADLDGVRRTSDTNLFGAWSVTLALLPLLRASAAPRIVNVSSEGGSLTNMGGGTPACSTSKAALNALTRARPPPREARGCRGTRCPGSTSPSPSAGRRGQGQPSPAPARSEAARVLIDGTLLGRARTSITLVVQRRWTRTGGPPPRTFVSRRRGGLG